VRYDPDGKVERRIATPAKQTSSCAFGGPNLDTLYITSAARSEITPEVPIGYNPEVGYLGGSLYRTRVEVQGLVQPKADIVHAPNSA
jgi:L-arabinonolactonase